MRSIFIPVILRCVLAVSAFADTVTTDICVYGANAGGVTAAVQAARMGKSAVLLSTNTHVGGMTSGGLGATDYVRATAIGGLALEFYWRIGARYGVNGPGFLFAPHFAEEEFRGMLADAGVPLRTGQRIASVTMDGQRIVEIAMDDGTVYRAGMFIDATYEGDLMALAGVTWIYGREGTATYGETINGFTPSVNGQQFQVNVDSYVTPGDPSSGLLPLVSPGGDAPVGSGDSLLQGYNYRLCLTSVASNRLPIDAPPGYDESRYELLGRLIDARLAAGQTIKLGDFMYPALLNGGKCDLNNTGPISTDYFGGNAGYIEASQTQRDAIASEHRNYIQGLLYYLGHSARVPASVQAEMLNWGLCADEFTDTGGWPHQLYVREARRMVSDYVMIEQNCTGTRTAPDSVGVGEYYMDSHFVQRYAKNGAAWNEGITVGKVPQPYPISYRSIVPRVGECENLLVPFAVSASHTAFTSIRMEPVFMILGQSAGTAAAFALDDGVPVQQLSYSRLALQLRADGQVLAWSSSTSGQAPAVDVIVDNADPGAAVTGSWTASTSLAGYQGANYLHDGNTGKGAKSVTFTPELPIPGTYDVWLRWTSSSNRAASVPVDVNYSGGTSTFTVNQQTNGSTWVQLTTDAPLAFDAGTAGSLCIRNDGTIGYVVADAARFTLRNAAPMVQVVATDGVAREAVPGDAARWTILRDASQTTDDLVVPYAISGTATPGANFQPLPGSVTIPAGKTAAQVALTVVPNDLVEGDKTVTLTLLPAPGFFVGAASSATVRIVDKPTVRFDAVTALVRAADPDPVARFTVTRDASATANDWIVSYALGGTAISGQDYLPLAGSVTIPADQSSAVIEMRAIPESPATDANTVTLTLLPGVEFSVGAGGAATATILHRPIDDWRFSHFTAAQLADATISADDADPDGDGLKNLAEYTLGLDPLVSNAAPGVYGMDGTGRLTLTYTQLRAATDVAIRVEGSTDLGVWSSGPEMVEEIARTPSGDVDVVTVRLVPAIGAQGFLRLSFSRQ